MSSHACIIMPLLPDLPEAVKSRAVEPGTLRVDATL